MVATTATVPTTPGVVINSVQRLVWLAAQCGLLHAKTCVRDLSVGLTLRARIQTRERDPSAWYCRG